ncbi:MAG: non-canonical purine NTP diphosphatase [Flavobacteriaceae bacterium]|nr:non-canonical purine NTP diphosphatase [Flavobacteriaceae bacterium]
MKLVFATHNQNKFEEVKQLLPPGIELQSLDHIGCHEEIAETGSTLAENARIKADHVTKHYGMACFSDDTGLLVDTLDGAPGVYSARYAGPEKNAGANMAKLLDELEGKADRSARFETAIALNIHNRSYLFVGQVQGRITKDKHGDQGFGYDPIFMPNGFGRTFAELSMDEKNRISHRGKAIEKLIAFLSELDLGQ